MNATSPTTDEPIRLTQFSHGGGCGCKIAPKVLSEILASFPTDLVPPELMVGTETSDDAAVWRLNDTQALVATTDFFTPIVDDPRDFGRIAATNALSDVYAMGARPIMALAVVGMPLDKLPLTVIRDILAGGQSVCAAAGVPIAGGHSIDVLEPIYGLVALGLVHPDKVKRNSDAKAGDVLILGKPLGVGILSAALKKGLLSAEGYAQMVDYTTRINKPGASLSDIDGVHAVTDVTGFGLGGHLLEICRGSGVQARLNFAHIPLIAEAARWVKEGVVTGASGRNWLGYGHEIRFSGEPWQQQMLSDPQTSGGLLVACAPEAQEQVLACFREEGFPEAAPIGHLQAGVAEIVVE